MAKVKYPVIADDAIINLSVQTSFYKDVAQLLMAHVRELGEEEYKKCVEKLQNRESAENLKQATVMIFTALVFSLEMAAKEQNLTKDVEIDVPDNSTKTTDTPTES